jgi:phosphoglycolate phosphatase-like HAD superfamily hydrolase
MKMTEKKILQALESADALLWDFDGVLLDSMSVRGEAFRFVLQHYTSSEVDTLLVWHQANGGLSRYVKFRYFMSEILDVEIDEAVVLNWADQFSIYCRDRLSDRSKLILPTNSLVQRLQGRIPMHIVSGSDGKELKELCNELGIADRFVTIEGSPTPKTDLVAGILNVYKYKPASAWLVGDAINDKTAAEANGLNFLGFRNQVLRESGCHYWAS